ncbi:hypothetical protein CBR_g52611 [Chara braunii]|uniref:Protein kinase domain-containing protein n=1 Tax=Chara braunii TaxID=69332 RepID=A0A388MAJ4_CHABU|nr:hypothetical protein CBR_g52611 [Chara braunii]|eukprot:GBG91576.1 hypothetical protein CBR_g52611 [Chara braunii]
MAHDLTSDKRKQFVAEVNALTRVNHVNLIELIGYCEEGYRCVLVYPYYQGGSLHWRLHSKQSLSNVHPEKSLPPLTLEERMRIAFQIALALNYLHGNTREPIIHRDIKSSNVLLGDGKGKKLHAVLSDFRLATMGERVFGTDHQEMVETSHIGGTFGYMAPEYLLKGKLSEKNDVYAFGILVLEMLKGRKVVKRAPSGLGVQTLRDWVKPFLEGGDRSETKVLQPGFEILDPCLRDEIPDASSTDMVTDTIQLAWVCVKMEDTERPRMNAVVHRIESILGKATFFGTRSRLVQICQPMTNLGLYECAKQDFFRLSVEMGPFEGNWADELAEILNCLSVDDVARGETFLEGVKELFYNEEDDFSDEDEDDEIEDWDF